MFWKKKKKPKKPSREEIIAQAKAAATAKREEIGDETLDQIRQVIMKKESSALAKAKKQVKEMDDDKVRDNLKFWLQEKD